MPSAPSTTLTGAPRAYWRPAELPGCPLGRLVCAVCPGEVPADALAVLHPVEQAYATSLVSSARRREWVGGRLCLAAALEGIPERMPLLATTSGSPCVPVGWAGSISHKGPLAVALAAATSGGVGVDVECIESRDERLQRKVLTATERMQQLEDETSGAMAIVMRFSLKEAVYKALIAADQKDLDFADIETVLPNTSPRIWLPIDVRLTRQVPRIEAALLFDGSWLIAAARRAPR